MTDSDALAEQRRHIEMVKEAALLRDQVKREQSKRTYLIEPCGHVCVACGGCPGCCTRDENGVHNDSQ